MAKICLICKDGIEYKDNIGKCPKCSNYLRKVDIKEKTSIDEEDPYKNYTQNNTNNQEFEEDSLDYESEFLYGNNTKHKCSENDKNESSTKEDFYKKINTKEVNKKSNKVCVSGVAHKILKENEKLEGIGKFTLFFEKLFNSLFMFENYPLTNDVIAFQLYDNEGFGNNYEDIIIKGRLENSQITDGNKVEVTGKRNRKGEILAKSILKKGSNVLIKPSYTISPVAVWIMVLGIIYGVYRILTIDWGLIFTNILNLLLPVIFMICFFGVILKMLFKSMFGK